jgi:hypothetical protein
MKTTHPLHEVDQSCWLNNLKMKVAHTNWLKVERSWLRIDICLPWRRKRRASSLDIFRNASSWSYLLRLPDWAHREDSRILAVPRPSAHPLETGGSASLRRS